MYKKRKRRYNATFRLRQKRVKVSTRAKTIYGVSELETIPEVKILIKENHYILQTELFT